MPHMITTNTLNGHVNLYLLRLYPCALYSPLLTEKQRVVFPVGNPWYHTLLKDEWPFVDGATQQEDLGYEEKGVGMQHKELIIGW